jgi:hypothetical protein
MKRIGIITLLIVLSSAFAACPPAQTEFLLFNIFYGDVGDLKVRTLDWTQFDMMILHPGTPQDEYKNLENDAFLLRIQEVREGGGSVFFYLSIGCEKDPEYSYSQMDSQSWLKFKKREISLFMRYADGVYFDCVGPEYEGKVHGPQFAQDVKQLVDYVHYNGGEVIIGDLWMLMDWVETNQLDLIPYEADYVLMKGAWSMTPSQYSDDFGPLNAIAFAQNNGLKVLGLDFGQKNDKNRMMYCYCASRVFGLSGFCYTEGNFYEEINIMNVPELGLPRGRHTQKEGARYTREFERGTAYVDFQTHTGWVEGEAAQGTGVSVILVVLGGLLGLYLKKRT